MSERATPEDEPKTKAPRARAKALLNSLTRGLTYGEKRTMSFERWTRYVVLGTAIGAAAGSFLALMWIGKFMGLAAPLLPITVDGLIIATSMGIIHSHSEKEPWWRRSTRWLGLAAALAVSVWGNVLHAQAQHITYMPPVAIIIFGGVAPIFAAYGLHVYGLALNTDSLADSILADDPGTVHKHIWKPGDPEPERAVRKPASALAPALAPALMPARERATSAGQPAVARAGGDKGYADLRARVLALLADDPDAKIIASDLCTEVGATCNPSTGRKWVIAARAEAERLAKVGPVLVSVP